MIILLVKLVDILPLLEQKLLVVNVNLDIMKMNHTDVWNVCLDVLNVNNMQIIV